MALTHFGGRRLGRLPYLVPFGLDLVHQSLHAAEIPAGAVFGFRDKAEQPAVQHDAAQLGDAVIVVVEAE